MNYAMDASAMIAFAAAEPGGTVVEELLADPRNRCFAHAANLCEVYYDACRRIGPSGADQPISDPASSGLGFRPDMYPAFWQQAGWLKAEVRRISPADCFGLAPAATVGAEFVTADRHEMEALTARYGYQIKFIRRDRSFR